MYVVGLWGKDEVVGGRQRAWRESRPGEGDLWERLHTGTPVSEWSLQLTRSGVTVQDVADALSFFKFLFYYFCYATVFLDYYCCCYCHYFTLSFRFLIFIISMLVLTYALSWSCCCNKKQFPLSLTTLCHPDIHRPVHLWAGLLRCVLPS